MGKESSVTLSCLDVLVFWSLAFPKYMNILVSGYTPLIWPSVLVDWPKMRFPFLTCWQYPNFFFSSAHASSLWVRFWFVKVSYGVSIPSAVTHRGLGRWPNSGEQIVKAKLLVGFCEGGLHIWSELCRGNRGFWTSVCDAKVSGAETAFLVPQRYLNQHGGKGRHRVEKVKGAPPAPPIVLLSHQINYLQSRPCQKLYYEKINPRLPEICGIVRLLLSLSPYFLLKNEKDWCNDTLTSSANSQWFFARNILYGVLSWGKIWQEWDVERMQASSEIGSNFSKAQETASRWGWEVSSTDS